MLKRSHDRAKLIRQPFFPRVESATEKEGCDTVTEWATDRPAAKGGREFRSLRAFLTKVCISVRKRDRHMCKTDVTKKVTVTATVREGKQNLLNLLMHVPNTNAGVDTIY